MMSTGNCTIPVITETDKDEKTLSTAIIDNNTAIVPVTTSETPTTCIQEETIIYEWVLLLPPQLTKSTYQLLIKYNTIVARGWHLDGRYGSRTHRYTVSNDILYIGIPIRSVDVLFQCAELSFTTSTTIVPNIEQQHKQNNVQKEKEIQFIPSLDNLCNNNSTSCRFVVSSSNTTTVTNDNATSNGNPLKDLLQKEGCRMYVVYKPYVQATNRNLHRPYFDATIHPERNRNRSNISSSSVLTSTITKEEDKATTITGTQSKSTTEKNNIHSFTYMELFAGIGGFGIALEALGGKCVFVSEIDDICQLIYKLNFPHNQSVLYGDIYTIPDSVFTTIHNKQQHIDILVGGFPCQPFSTLGKQNGIHDSKGILFLQIVRVLQLCTPTIFILENVQGLIQMKETYTIILNAFRDCNYTVTTKIIDSRCVTATTRKRLYFIGIKNNNHQQQQQQTNPTFEFPYMPDLLIRAKDVITYETEPIRNDDELLSTSTTTTTSTMSSSSLTVIDGIDIKHLYVSDEQLFRLNEQKYWKPSKLAWPDTTCDTLISHYGTSIGRGHSQLVPTYTNPRRFTPKECSRIMGFPNTYKLPSYTTTTIPITKQNDGIIDEYDCNENNDSHKNVPTDDGTSNVNNNTATSVPFVHLKQQYKVFGNAVCPPIIAALAGAVLHCCPTISGYHHHGDWTQHGLDVAIDLAKKATIPKTE